MKVLILSALPIIGFVIGGLLARRGGPDTRRLEQDYAQIKQKMALADECLDDLSYMAAEHAALNEPGGVLMGERIKEYRRVTRNQK